MLVVIGPKQRVYMTTTDRTKWTALGLVATVLVIVSAALGHRAIAQGEIRLDPNASCTAACHTDFGKKKHVHAVAASGQGCAGLCHQPVEKGRHAFKPLPARRSELCGMCHQQPAKAHPHVPVKLGLCTTCHDPHQSDHARLLKKPAPELCSMCHQNRADKAHVHLPVKAGLCTTCHEPHQSEHARLLARKSPELCYQCHDAKRFEGRSVHGPVAQGQCLGCHAPHAAEHKALLGKTDRELCLSCHAAAIKTQRGRSLPAIGRLYEDKNVHLHPPFAAGQCTFCHTPHASTHGALAAKPYPVGMYATYAGSETYGLCFTCHAAKAFEQPRTLTDTGFRNGNLNLHYRHVNREKGRACGVCHNPHGSPQARLIDPVFLFGNQNLGLKFEKSDTGGSCNTACHGPMKYDRCLPEAITMRTTPRPGTDATPEELLASCEKELEMVLKKAKETKKK